MMEIPFRGVAGKEASTGETKEILYLVPGHGNVARRVEL
jgi:uncharacterized protein YabN with tetrapyrrole methylase and pyrophosphatase domain